MLAPTTESNVTRPETGLVAKNVQRLGGGHCESSRRLLLLLLLASPLAALLLTSPSALASLMLVAACGGGLHTLGASSSTPSMAHRSAGSNEERVVRT